MKPTLLLAEGVSEGEGVPLGEAPADSEALALEVRLAVKLAEGDPVPVLLGVPVREGVREGSS